ncbi:hypothetical protein SCACP_02060 [Sporomusa carbonis]|uniref:hypothetical protein n=1 Tax=Sporomusa carbonis TaxID=3076075 RepID=UPI003A6125E0
MIAKQPCYFSVKRDYRHPDAVIPGLAALFTPNIVSRCWQPPDFPWPDSVKQGERQ